MGQPLAMNPPPMSNPMPEPEPVEDNDSEQSLIKRFEENVRRPDTIKTLIDGMEEDRRYIHTDANLPDQPGGVASNYLLRYQWIHQAQIYAKDPAVAVRPRKKLGVLVPEIQAVLTDFAKSVEYLVQHFAKEGKLRQVLDGAIQDIDTVGIVFLKVNWIEDLNRDPSGSWRPQSLLEDTRKLTVLAERFHKGEISEDDADYAVLKDLSESVQKAHEAEYWRKIAYPTQAPSMDPMTGQPVMGDAGMPVLEDVVYPEGADPRQMRWEGVPTPPQITQVPSCRQFVYDVFDPEDVWWDWCVTRPEMLHRGEHITTRVWMTSPKIQSTYSVEADSDALPGKDPQPSQAAQGGARVDPDRTMGAAEIDQGTRNGSLAVLERQQADGWIYTWVQGAKKFLRKERQEIETSFRYNVFPILFNRVSGRVLPVSNTMLGRPLQNEINTVRTHKRQAKRAAYDKYATLKNLFDEATLEEMRKCPPNGFFPTDKTADDLAKGIFRMPGQFNEAVHSVIEERQELGALLGQSQASQGMTKGGADSATEAAIANQSAGAMADRHKDILTFAYGDLFTYMAEVLVQALPEDSAKAIGGPGTLWPLMDRAALWAHLQIDIEAGSTGKPDQQKRLDALRQGVEIGQMAGIGADPMQPKWNALKLMRKLADILDWADDPADLLDFSMMMVPPPPGMAPPGAPPGAAGPGGPQGGPPQLPNPADQQAPQNMPPLPMTNQAPEVAAAG